MTAGQATPSQGTQRARSNEPDWDAIYEAHIPRVYNYFRFRFGSNADAQDLTARTFEKAWRKREQFARDVSGFSTWLFHVAHNVGVDYLRTRRDHVPIEAVDDPVYHETPETETQRRSDLARLAKLTSDLPEQERELIALKYGSGLNNRLIAKLTGLSESNVGTILHRLVQALRARW
jgi:RNA polymerase sigma-70 factor, ECF subfamily